MSLLQAARFHLSAQGLMRLLDSFVDTLLLIRSIETDRFLEKQFKKGENHIFIENESSRKQCIHFLIKVSQDNVPCWYIRN